MTRYTPLWEQQGSYAASVDRRLMGGLWPAAACTGCAVSVSSGMTVNVAAGTVAVPTANNTGTVVCASDAVEPVTLAAAPGSGSNRYDLIICQARGNDLDGGANNDFLFTTVTGTAAASPSVPAVPSNAVALAQVYIPGGSASVTAGNITDVRPLGLAVNKGVEVFNTTVNLIGGSLTTEASLGVAIVVPALAYPYRVHYWATENYSLAAAGTVDQHVRYNTTGTGAAVGDTLHRSARMSLAAANQQSIVSVGSIDRPSGPTTLSLWAVTSGPTATVAADPTTGQFNVRVVLQ